MLGDKVRRSLEDTGRPLSGPRRAYGRSSPPFQKVATGVIWVGFRIDPDAVRPFLPEGLVLSPASIGVLGIYQASTGYGVAPYVRGLVGVSVEGVPGSDVGEGMFVMGNIMDEPGASMMRRFYSSATVEGHAQTWRDGDAAARGGLGRGRRLAAGDDPAGRSAPDLSGIDNFLGETAAGLVKHADLTVADLADAEVVSLEITDDAPDYMRALRPLEHVFALHAERVNSIWSEPRVVGRTASGNASTVFLGLIEDTGRAAAVVRQDGTLIEANSSGLALLGPDGPRAGEPLFSGLAAERQALSHALKMSCARKGPRVSEPIALTRPGGWAPAGLCDAARTWRAWRRGGAGAAGRSAWAGTARRGADAAIVRPDRGRGQAGGTGRRGPRAARGGAGAEDFRAYGAFDAEDGYDKLGIKKQSELGHLVARLQYL